MPNEPICPVCQNVLPTDAAEGLCPRCVLRAAMPERPTPATITPEFEQAVRKAFPEWQDITFIGKGGFGTVFRVYHPDLSCDQAVKIISVDAAPDLTDRFQIEIKALRDLSHEGIVTLRDAGRRGDFRFLRMDYMPGGDLHQALKNGLSPQAALDLLPAVCDALHYAHTRTPAILHRDLKPANILLYENGKPKIGDFGLAKFFHAEAEGHTRTGVGFGTENFTAPEQWADASKATALSDIYSLGAIIHYLADRASEAGQPLPPVISTIADKATAREPQHRYQAVQELKEDLRNSGISSKSRPLTGAIATNNEIAPILARSHLRTILVAGVCGLGISLAFGSFGGIIVTCVLGSFAAFGYTIARHTVFPQSQRSSGVEMAAAGCGVPMIFALGAAIALIFLSWVQYTAEKAKRESKAFSNSIQSLKQWGEKASKHNKVREIANKSFNLSQWKPQEELFLISTRKNSMTAEL